VLQQLSFSIKVDKFTQHHNYDCFVFIVHLFAIYICIFIHTYLEPG
jgi:hypothetical protein